MRVPPPASRLATIVALMVLSALVVVLSYQKRGISARYDLLVRRLTQPGAGLLVPPLHTETLAGDSVAIADGPPEQRDILFVFNTTCPHCLATLPVWQRIAESVLQANAHVYGVSLDSADATLAYVAENGITYPVVRFPSRRMAELYRAGTVPLTLVVSGDGRVSYARAGRLEGHGVADSVLKLAARD